MLKDFRCSRTRDDFVFDNQMLAQCVYFGFRIGEVSCPTKYFAEASSINFRRSVQYGLGVLLNVGAVPPAEDRIGTIPDFQPQRPLPGAGSDARYYSPKAPEKRSPTAGPAANVAERTRIARWDFVADSALANLAAPLATFAMLVQGYHTGLEDDAFYLAAIKHNLNPALFPHDADFFRVQFQATIFDKLIASSLRWTHVSAGMGNFVLAVGRHRSDFMGMLASQPRCFAEAHAHGRR